MPSGNPGKKHTQEHNDRVAAAHRGLHHSEETRNKLSEANIKTWKKKVADGYVSPLKGRRKC